MTDQTREQMEARAREYFVTALPPELYAFVEMDLGRFAKVAAMFALREIEVQNRWIPVSERLRKRVRRNVEGIDSALAEGQDPEELLQNIKLALLASLELDAALSEPATKEQL